jgi:hypothetical protein
LSDHAPHRSPEFIKFWVGQSLSLVGSEVSQLAMPLLAVLSLGASPGEIGVLRAVNFAPYLLSLPVGVLVDRTRRRPLLIGADLLRVYCWAPYHWRPCWACWPCRSCMWWPP